MCILKRYKIAIALSISNHPDAQRHLSLQLNCGPMFPVDLQKFLSPLLKFSSCVSHCICMPKPYTSRRATFI